MNGEELIQPTFELPELFIGQELVELEDHARRGRFSGAVLEKKRGLVRQICHCLALGMGVDMIADAFEVSLHSVMGIRDRHPDLIASEKQHVRRKFSRLQFLMTERIEKLLMNRVSDLGLRDLSIGLGIVTDKLALMDGEPTARLDVTKRDVDPVDVVRALEAMKRATIAV